MTRFLLLCKRQLTQPFFLLFCLLLPLSCALVSHLEASSSSGIRIGLFAREPESYTDALFSRLCSETSALSFEVFSDEEQMCSQVMCGALDCAYSFGEDFHEHLLNGSYKKSILCYTTSGTLMKDLSREVIFSTLFQQLGVDLLTGYAKASSFPLFGENNVPEEYLSALYEKYLYSEQVFSLRHDYSDRPAENIPDAGASDSSTSASSAVTMPVRGLIAVFLFVSALSGGVVWLQDKENKLNVSAVADIAIPLLFMTFSSCAALALTAQARHWGEELFVLVLYCLLLCGFVRVLLLFIKRPVILSASIPVFVLGSLIFCPIFINLAALLPFFRFMEKLFLPYYYLVLS